MRVLLVRPGYKGNTNTRLPQSLNERQGELPPLGISYIASALEGAGHNVKILDLPVLNLGPDALRREVRSFEPRVAGITTMTPLLFEALAVARIAKEAGAITVLGGPQLSIYPEETLSYPYVDYGINGEGDFAMRELTDALENNASVEGIKGLIYRKGGRVYINEPAIVDDIDSLPFPAYHLLPMKRYNSIIGSYPVSTMVSSRGCPYKCSFCFKQPSDDKIRFRSAKNVADEMEFLSKGFKVKEIMFYDDVMTFKRAHITGICEEILSRNLKIKWETPARVDNIDAPLLELMHRAGCIRLRYGVESGDEEVLAEMNKKVDLKQARHAFKMTKNAGIGTFAYFMLGYPGETADSIKKTINLALELNPDFVMFTVTTPYPKTPLYAMARGKGYIINDYWREFSLGNMGRSRIPYLFPGVDSWARTAYMKFYFRPGYIFNRISRIRSVDDLIKCLKGARGILRLNN